MIGDCKLCGLLGELKESHFIPKFVGKWLKNTSITGYIREKNNLRKRAQDIAKDYWLCDSCEEMLSNWETKFANTIFYPFLNEGKTVASYSEWMSRFCASMSWRTLTYIRSKNSDKSNPQEYYDKLTKAENHLAAYLLGKINNLNEYEQHFYPLGRLESTTTTNLPANINRYFLRTMSMDIVGNNQDLYIYTKLPSFIILGIIQCSKVNKMRLSRIALKSGTINKSSTIYNAGGF
jgi:hypothetical protein